MSEERRVSACKGDKDKTTSYFTRGFDIIGALDVYDSRFSTIDPRQNWTLGVVFKNIKHIVVGIVGNAKAEIGVGIGIRLPIATIQFGENQRSLNLGILNSNPAIKHLKQRIKFPIAKMLCSFNF